MGELSNMCRGHKSRIKYTIKIRLTQCNCIVTAARGQEEYMNGTREKLLHSSSALFIELGNLAGWRAKKTAVLHIFCSLGLDDSVRLHCPPFVVVVVVVVMHSRVVELSANLQVFIRRGGFYEARPSDSLGSGPRSARIKLHNVTNLRMQREHKRNNRRCWSRGRNCNRIPTGCCNPQSRFASLA